MADQQAGIISTEVVKQKPAAFTIGDKEMAATGFEEDIGRGVRGVGYESDILGPQNNPDIKKVDPDPKLIQDGPEVTMGQNNVAEIRNLGNNISVENPGRTMAVRPDGK